MVNFFQPIGFNPEAGGMFDPTQEAKIKQQRALAERLQAIGGPKGTQMVSGGKYQFAVPQSFGEQASRGLAAGLGSYQEAEAGRKEQALEKSRADLLAGALGQMDEGDLKGAYGTLAQDPRMAGTALEGYRGEIEAQRERDMMAQILGNAGGGQQNVEGNQRSAADLAKMGVVTGNPALIKYAEFERDSNLKNLKDQREQGKYDQGLLEKEQTAQSTVDKTTDSMNQVQALLQHPGLESVVGAKNILSGAISDWNPFAEEDPVTGMVPPVAGTEAADFYERFKQVKGGQFMQALETLKGGGQITEIEGKKGTDAISRMSVAQSEGEFREAANDYIEVMQLGAMRTGQPYGITPGGAQPPQPDADPASGWTITPVD